MPSLYFDEYPSRDVIRMRAAWVAHYIAKGCSVEKAQRMATCKTHTWPGDTATVQR